MKEENQVTKRKKKTVERSDSESTKPEVNKKESVTKPLRYGPLPASSPVKLVLKAVIVCATFTIIYFTVPKKETKLAKHDEFIKHRFQKVDCSASFINDMLKYKKCMPNKCGRLVTDKLISYNEADVLLNLARKAFALGGSDGGASILDLHSGSLSFGRSFINISSFEETKNIFDKNSLSVYSEVKRKIQSAVGSYFGIDHKLIYLTYPTFFSEMTNAPPKTIHDEYWHVHVDKQTYESFHYTSLLYLSDYKVEFDGGRFVFTTPKNVTIEPIKGRVLIFTSGEENPHVVERVTKGKRYAITVSFTCDQTKKISDPHF